MLLSSRLTFRRTWNNGRKLPVFPGKCTDIPARDLAARILLPVVRKEARMFKARPAAEVSTVLEEAATAFDRCLQALKAGDAQTIRRPRPGASAPADSRSDL